MSTSTFQPDVTPKDIIRAKLSRLAQLESIIAETTSKQQKNVTAIITATKQVLAPVEAEQAALEAEIKALVTDNRESLCGKKKSLGMDTHTIAFRASTTVECDDEDEVVNQLETFAADPEVSEADSIAASACLRQKPATLDKEFVRKNWAKYSSWFSAHFGLRLGKKESVSITANKVPTADA